MRRRLFARPGVSIAVAAFVALVVAALMAHLGATLLVKHQGPLSTSERLKATNDARTGLIQLLAGIGLTGGLLFTGRTYVLARRGQRTERFSKGVEQIGGANATVRSGGAYTLESLANEEEAFWQPVTDVLTALIREGATPEGDVPSDVQAALTVLGRRPRRVLGHAPSPVDLHDLNLARANLVGANLERANLAGVRLRGANLSDASLIDASLQGADLSEAILSGAHLDYANLTDASLQNATLYGTVFKGANLTRCNLHVEVQT